jgi:hypothetical protein
VEFFISRFLERVSKMSPDNTQVELRVHGLGPMDCYHVTEDELDRIIRDGNDLGLEFAFAQFGITVGLSFLANLLITPMELGKVYVTFVVVIAVGFVFGIANAIKWFRSRGEFSRTIRKIRDRRVGPVGKQGKEVTPSELDQLSSSESPLADEQAEPKP